MNSHTPGTNGIARGIPSSPAGTSGTVYEVRTRNGPAAATKKVLPMQICEKCGSSFHQNPYEMRHNLSLCLECRERYVRICTACKKPYRTDQNPHTGGLCRTCYYLVYDDDDDSD